METSAPPNTQTGHKYHAGESTHSGDPGIAGAAENEGIARLCHILNLPTNVQQQAENMLFHACSEEFQKDDIASLAACIYVTTVDARLPYGLSDPQATTGILQLPFVSVTELLRAANVCLVDLFSKMHAMKQVCPPSDAVQQHLLGVERKYLIILPLFHKFEGIFEDIFINFSGPQLETDNEGDSDKEGFLERKKFCWTLFIYAKSQVMHAGSMQLVLCFHLLLCCIHYVLRMTPRFQLKPPLDDLAEAGDNVDMPMLNELCTKYQADFTEVQMVQAGCLDPVIQDLPQVDGTIDVAALVETYTRQYKTLGDINELLFLDGDPHLIFNERERNNNVVTENSRPDNDVTEPDCDVMNPPVTPVRHAMTSVQQLRNLLSTASDTPSQALSRYFKTCAVDPQPSISARLAELKAAFTSGFTEAAGDAARNIVEHRFQLAVGLYYRVMESLLQQEEERLSHQDFSHMLHNASFHKCFLACAAEVVLTVYDSNLVRKPDHTDPNDLGSSFMWILSAFKIKAFEFFKVLESFIRAEPRLTKDIVKHLQSIESRILERVAWTSDSPVHEFINQRPLVEKTDASPAKDPCASPMAVRCQNTAFTNSPRSQRSRALDLFLKKVCRLGYSRMLILCTKLNLAKDLQHQIWKCLEHCLCCRPDLLRDRHLDQVILCSIYAVCKVTEQEITFKAMVPKYRELGHATPQVYKHVLITGCEYDTIIGFYNRIFMQDLKTYLLLLSANKCSPSQSSMPSPASHKASPVYAVHARKNFFISPMKSSPFKAPPSPSQMTPRTRLLYNFGEQGFGSAESLRRFNGTMSAMQTGRATATSRPSKRLHFEGAEGVPPEDDAGCDPSFLAVKKRVISPSSRKSLLFGAPRTHSSNGSPKPSPHK